MKGKKSIAAHVKGSEQEETALEAMDVCRDTHPGQGHDCMVVLKSTTRPCVKRRITLEKCDYQNLTIIYILIQNSTLGSKYNNSNLNS